ncbi:MAG: ATPase, T2SS/T4P/T4SS family [Nanoarchaeota archaeon]|nr:Flp pilus assembly complex ATPase component TadA [Nanoarchaeota archaeon]MBU1632065.1 Flp pilus assembly complex ATPase component TadA [Nanoarchaeota archaeon]MBU1875699.1 Flp pilus assembly complex ATPase component TadA [Nanoarchaeota archaeon]
MVLEESKNCFDFETFHEGENKILKIYCEKCTFPPSIEYSNLCMGKTVDVLLQVNGVTQITLSQQREYEYDYDQANLLVELTSVYKRLNKEERFTYSKVVVDPLHERYIRGSYAQFQRLISKLLKEDPLAAFVELKRLETREKIKLNNLINPRHLLSQQKYIAMMQEAIRIIEQIKLIKLLMPHTKGYKVGDRLIYENVFHPTTRPDFMYTKLITAFPEGNLLESYDFSVDKDSCEVNIFSFDDDIKTMYHLTPSEFKFTEEEYELLDDAKRIMSEHKPTREEFVDPQRMREVFFNIGKDLISDIMQHKNINFDEDKIDLMAQALLRHTVGFGMIELLLSDPKVQDVNINSPNGELPIFIVHQDHGDCYTNIYPTRLEVDSWATKLRLISGRPFDEADPILDTELKVKGFTSRVSALTAPLSPLGLAFSFRRHRDFPWTFPLYLQPKIRYMSSLAAGLLNFIIDNNATILIAGTRSSGKSSLLGSFLVEIQRRARIITIEDTFELPQESLRALGYNIESLKVASALASKEGSEVDPSIGIRSTLRLGDSAIFVGEVRSKEAVALFEAMRVGAAANVVAGTIHADTPYGVYDRVVNDIGVPKTSFKAIDIIVVTNPVISGLKKYKRILRVTEVRKEWDEDPLKEGAFVDLMVYNPKTDQLEITDDLINGNSAILKRMAGRVKEFAGDWDAVWNNIELRGRCKQAVVDVFNEVQDESILEAGFVIKANDMFHIISSKIKDKFGSLDSDHIYFEFKEWLRKEVKKKQMKL